ncbi:programmed cell death 6-interacting protein [Cimex lectularius]|uniref:BRO1 domain-containing protein n=1 Tax=Cimex lectularius TaxID=79782 RepID=A0A8I6SLL3_CIMLE|nr:programmed cell death 6-interacting protein [Cimex lectularius]
MAELLALPLKKPTDVDMVKPLTNLISTAYNTADKPDQYNEQIKEFSKLRSSAVWKSLEKFETSLEVIYRYYDQLHALETKIPPTDVQIPFKWKDAFNKGSLFGGRVSLTLPSLSYEKVCVLYNIAALQSSIAASQSLESDEGLKLAAKLFQQASGILSHLKNSVIAAIQVDPTSDLNPETLAALSSLLLAQAQEVFVMKAIHDSMKEAVVAKLCAQCTEFYADTMVLLQKDGVRNIVEKDWIPLVAGKQAAFIGLAHYFQSIVCKGEKLVGEEIARLQRAVELLKCAQQRSGHPNMFNDYVSKAERALAAATKDNDFIYHDRIPDLKQLAPIQRAALAKQIPLPSQLSSHFKDLFEGLVPLPVHQALAAYEIRKAELVNREISELRTATQLLNSVLSSLNLPAALEESSGETVPQSLIEKSNNVIQKGGIEMLEKKLNELPQLLQRNNDILMETQRALDEEQATDLKLKEQFKEKWNRVPSERLTKVCYDSINKYRELIKCAVDADQKVNDKFQQNKKGIILLSGGVEKMKERLPQPGWCNKDTPACLRLKQLMEEVETMKAERDVIEMELKSTMTDLKDVFLASLADQGHINEPAVSTETLGKAYGPLQQNVKDSINKQQTLLQQIQETNTEFTAERGRDGTIKTEREEMLKELANAHDTFDELEKLLAEGMKFYNDMTEHLVTLQNKTMDYCFARNTEKEELLKDITKSLSQLHPDSTGSFRQSAETKKEPPARPPPPQTSANPSQGQQLPYPVQPGQMPMPYALAPVAPYPPQFMAPMPVGYNPYATIASYTPNYFQQYSQPQTGAPGYNQGQVPYQHFGTYPGAGGYQQQPSNQPPQW